jgi:hypothetical protein
MENFFFFFIKLNYCFYRIGKKMGKNIFSFIFNIISDYKDEK